MKITEIILTEDEFQNYRYHPQDDKSTKQMKAEQLYSYLRKKKGMDHNTALVSAKQILNNS